MLVDKSLVVADDTADGMRYRLLETVRQYAQEKLGESGEADDVRTRHRDYYTARAIDFESHGLSGLEALLNWAQSEIDNLRAAYSWSLEKSEPEIALELVSAVQQVWIRCGRFREGLAGFDALLTDETRSHVTPAAWVRGVAYHGVLCAWAGARGDVDRSREALAIARELDVPALLALALVGRGALALYEVDKLESYVDEAIDLVRAIDDRWSLCQTLAYLAVTNCYAGEPIPMRAAAEEGRELADALGDRFFSRNCRTWLGLALCMQGNLTEAQDVLHALAEEAEAARDLPMTVFGQVGYGQVLAFQGRAATLLTSARSAFNAAEAMGGLYGDTMYAMFAHAALITGDGAGARQAAEEAWRHTVPARELYARCFNPMAEAALACGDVAAARRWVDDTVAMVPGWHQMGARTVRAHIALAQGDLDQAERDAHEALVIAARTQGYLRVADALECLVRLAAGVGTHSYGARLLGASAAIRERMGHARFALYREGYDSAVAAIREGLGQNAFDAAWAEGAALSTEEAIAYAQRGRGERKRPSSGWESLTPMENDVVRLVREGLGNKEIGARLFISPRTVQTHLTHVYSKLGLTSRVQLVQEAGRRS